MKKLLALIAVAFAAVPSGPLIGTTAPDFQAADQDGAMQTLKSLSGPKGLMLVFFRSADW